MDVALIGESADFQDKAATLLWAWSPLARRDLAFVGSLPVPDTDHADFLEELYAANPDAVVCLGQRVTHYWTGQPLEKAHGLPYELKTGYSFWPVDSPSQVVAKPSLRERFEEDMTNLRKWLRGHPAEWTFTARQRLGLVTQPVQESLL